MYDIRADASGSFSIPNMPDNYSILPPGTVWHFSISPNIDDSVSVQFVVSLSAPDTDLSQTFTEATTYQISRLVQSFPIPRAADPSEVAGVPNDGQLYFNTTNQTLYVWAEGAWSAVGSGGGGGGGATIPPTTNILVGDGAGNAANSGIAPANVALKSDITNFLPLSGGTLTGPLNLSADPTIPLEAATKQYVDANIGSSSSGAMRLIQKQELSAPAAAITFNNIPQTYETLMLVIRVIPTGGADNVVASFNSATGYYMQAIYALTNVTGGGANNTSTLAIANSGDVCGNIVAYILGYNKSDKPPQMLSISGTNFTAGTYGNMAGIFTGFGPTAVVASLTIALAGGGNMGIGSSVLLYGIGTDVVSSGSTIAPTTNLLLGDGSGNATNSGIAPANVPLLNSTNNSFAGSITQKNLYVTGVGPFNVTDPPSGQFDFVNISGIDTARFFSKSSTSTVGGVKIVGFNLNYSQYLEYITMNPNLITFGGDATFGNYGVTSKYLVLTATGIATQPGQAELDIFNNNTRFIYKSLNSTLTTEGFQFLISNPDGSYQGQLASISHRGLALNASADGSVEGIASGTRMSWNLPSGAGNTVFINYKGGGGGGFSFYNVADNTTVDGTVKPVAYIDGVNSLNSNFSIRAYGGNNVDLNRSNVQIGTAQTNYPLIRLIASTAPADQKIWQEIVDQGDGTLNYQSVNDANTEGLTWLKVTRNGDIANTASFICHSEARGAFRAYGFEPPVGDAANVQIGSGSDFASPSIWLTRADNGASYSIAGWSQALILTDYAGNVRLAINNGNVTVQGDFNVTGGAKNFKIPHPLDPDNKVLTHSCLEGPECAVFYRGEGKTDYDGVTTITLPDYFEALTRQWGRTVQLTAIIEDEESIVFAQLAATRVKDGQFKVRSNQPEIPFWWEVKAIRNDIKTLEVVTDKEK